MRTLKLFCLLSLTIGRLYADDSVHFLVAIKGEQNVRSTVTTANSGWDIEIGEVYQFVRGMSASEYNGGPSGDDNTYVVIQIGNVQAVAPAVDFLPVAEKDMVEAAMKYNDEVAQDRQTQQTAQSAAPVGLHHAFSDPKIEARYEQIAQGLIAKGIDPTQQAVMAILQPELDAGTAQAQAGQKQASAEQDARDQGIQEGIDRQRNEERSQQWDQQIQQQQQDGERFQQQQEQDAQHDQQQMDNAYPSQ